MYIYTYIYIYICTFIHICIHSATPLVVSHSTGLSLAYIEASVYSALIPPQGVTLLTISGGGGALLPPPGLSSVCCSYCGVLPCVALCCSVLPIWGGYGQ